MEEIVAEFMAKLMIIGMKKEDVSANGYEYALQMERERLQMGVNDVTTKMMLHAAELMVKAQPIARRIYDSHYQMR